MFTLKQFPNANGPQDTFDGSDGRLYFGEDVEVFKKLDPKFRTRKTKYGVNYYFDNLDTLTAHRRGW